MVSRLSSSHWQVGEGAQRDRLPCTLTAVQLEGEGWGRSTSEAP